MTTNLSSFSVTYSHLLSDERCKACFCCTPCASECGCAGSGENKDDQVWRILGVNPSDVRVLEAERARERFVKESEIKFNLTEEKWGESDAEEKEGKSDAASDESSLDSDD